MKEDSIIIVDDDGNEIEMKIYFTFDYADKQYVVVYEENSDDIYYAFTYDEDRNIFPVDDEEELAIIDEVISAYEEEN